MSKMAEIPPPLGFLWESDVHRFPTESFEESTVPGGDNLGFSASSGRLIRKTTSKNPKGLRIPLLRTMRSYGTLIADITISGCESTFDESEADRHDNS